MFDDNCKWHESCGADMCHGEGVCRDFEKITSKCAADEGDKARGDMDG